MALLDADLDNATLEDATPLIEIQEMAAVRAGAVKVNFTPTNFFETAPSESALKKLRDLVYALGKEFINMDYPYYYLGWALFPLRFTNGNPQADAEGSRRPHREPLGTYGMYINREHPIEDIPPIDSCFDSDTVEKYRTFLKNLVYWLRKFRYVRMPYWTTKTFKRKWSWSNYWWSGQMNEEAYENGLSSNKSLGSLKSGGEGTVVTNYIQYWDQTAFSTQGSIDRHQQKYWDHERNGPLQEHTDNYYDFEIAQIPENVVVPNPTAYAVTAYCYMSPEVNIDRGQFFIEDDWTWITDADTRTITWGYENQYTGTYYDAENGERSNTRKSFRNGQMKEIYSDTIVDNTRREITTAWTDDGSRSVVLEDNSSSYGNLYTYWHSIDERLFEDFHFTNGMASSSVQPCRNLGTINPHENLVWEVCTQSTIPTTRLDFGTPVYNGIQAWGIGLDYIDDRAFQMHWTIILDFGDFEIPEPEEESE